MAPQCQKHIVIGTTEEGRLSETECIRRLKRWYIGGGNAVVEDSWPDGRKREYHVFHYGGRRLKDLATDCIDSALFGVSDEELDALCRHTDESATELRH